MNKPRVPVLQPGLKQTQTLSLTPQLLEAIELLAMTNLELMSFVDAELVSNPLLKEGEQQDPHEGFDLAASSEDAGDIGNVSSDLQSQLSDMVETCAQSYDQIHAKLGDVFDHDFDGSAAELGDASDRSFSRQHSLDGLSLSTPISGAYHSDERVGHSFTDHSYADDSRTHAHGFEMHVHDALRRQFYLDTFDPRVRLVFEALLNHLDERGYYTGDLQETATALGVDLAFVFRVLARLQSLDPAGVGARDWKECFQLQLQRMGAWSDDVAAVLDHFETFARHDFKTLFARTGLDRPRLEAAVRSLKRCCPNPFAPMHHTPVSVRVPDVIVFHLPNGGFGVDVNSETLPKVLVDMDYYHEVTEFRCARSSDRDETRVWLGSHLARAHWLTKALHQRHVTLMKVASALVSYQSAFLKYGVQNLKPLTISQVAQEVCLSESTVSRVCQGKYMDTPRGVLCFRDFFSQAIGSRDHGDGISTTALRDTLRQLIANEGENVLSDQHLADLLLDMGFDVARRTVAKYRESMSIPTSAIRKRQKRA